MTKSKNSKRALLASVLSMFVCIAMLIGATFAWFTDTASTSVNSIKSGTLTFDLVNESGVSIEDGILYFRNVDKSEDILWEPGATYNLDSFKIKNTGSLALKYSVIIDGIKGDNPLLEVIDFTVKEGSDSARPLENWECELLTPGNESELITITGKMKESAGNEYQNQTLEGVKITVNATQTPYEKDSIDDKYDELLTLTGTELVGALGSSTVNEAAFGEDIHLGHDGIDSTFVIDGDKKIDLNDHTVFGPDTGGGDGLEVEGYTVSFANGTFKQEGSLSCMQIYPGSNVTFDNMSFVSENTTTNRGSAVKITAESDDTGEKTTVVFNGCTFDGAVPSFSGNSSDPLELDVQFIDCTFKNIKSEGSWDACLLIQDDVWGTVLVDGCTIDYDGNSYGSAIWIMGDSADHQLKLTLKDSTVNITRGNHLRVGSNAVFDEQGTNTYQVNGTGNTLKRY